MKGIVSFDYDMTLLDHASYRIPDSALRALEALRKKYYIVLATGRDLDTKFSAGILEQVRPDATIQLNGTKITVGNQLVYEHFMRQELVERLLDFAAGRPYAVGLTTGDRDYYTNQECIVDYDLQRWGESDRNFRELWKPGTGGAGAGGSISGDEISHVFRKVGSRHYRERGFQG